MAKNKDAQASRTIGGVTVTARMVVFAVAAILAVWFILMNTASVKIHLWGISTVSSPLWIVLAFMLFVGMLLGWFGRRYRDNRKQ
jgi:uncharacterized integral membrane protein